MRSAQPRPARARESDRRSAAGRPLRPAAGGRLETQFIGGREGAWRIAACEAITGTALATATRLAVIDGAAAVKGTWVLRGVTSYERYVNVGERGQLMAAQPELGRASATRAALIPISKSPDWWALTAEQRREIFEESSHHIALGLRALPAVARRLYHGRDLGEEFDFLTWFEYSPEDAAQFEALVTELRRTPEWSYVAREIDIRLER